jgi:hypothetical protein
MNLANYLDKNRHDDPPKGTVGVESDWLPFCAIEVATGSLWAGDPSTANAEAGFVFQVPSGTYLLEARVMDFAGRKRISRLRVYLQGARAPVAAVALVLNWSFCRRPTPTKKRKTTRVTPAQPPRLVSGQTGSALIVAALDSATACARAPRRQKAV